MNSTRLETTPCKIQNNCLCSICGKPALTIFIQEAKNVSKSELSGKSQLKKQRFALDCGAIKEKEKPKKTTPNCNTFVRICGKHKTVSCYLADTPRFNGISSYEILGLRS
jgi:hypothetical protein